MLRLPALATGLIVAWLATVETGPEAYADPELFVTAGCAACHGSSAEGDLGPTLANTGLTFVAFLEQLRDPRGVMPPVTVGAVSDERARALFDFVRELEPPEGGPVTGSACRGGHHGLGSHHGNACGHGVRGHGHGRGGSCRHGACAGGAAG